MVLKITFERDIGCEVVEKKERFFVLLSGKSKLEREAAKKIEGFLEEEGWKNIHLSHGPASWIEKTVLKEVS